MDDADWIDEDEPVDSCDECGCNLYEGDLDGSGLCDQCRWWIEKANERD